MVKCHTNYQTLIDQAYERTKHVVDKGEVATYIPELANADPEMLGVYVSKLNGTSFGTGDCRTKFSLQSITKVLSLALAYKLIGEDVWKRVNVEPSGTKFDSLILLETDDGIPRNPFINSGAIVVCDILLSHLADARADFLAFVRELSGIPDLGYSENIAASEKSSGYRNTALCNFMKSFGNIENRPEDVLDFYCDMCSIEMTCEQLSRTFGFLANAGALLGEEKRIVSKQQSKRINALMSTCGFYNESGEFAFRVGLPGKSGVAGGIVAVYPGHYVIAVWSPRLNAKGNSYRGMKLLEEITTLSELTIF